MNALQPPEKTKGAAPEELAPFATDRQDHTLEKRLATIRARLCLAGGQVLHLADDGVFFVTTPFGQITKFNDLAALQAYVAKVGA